MSDFLVAFMVIIAITTLTTFTGEQQRFASAGPCRIEVGPVKLCW